MRAGNTWIMLLAVAVAVPCLATNYYVAASGSTPTEPWTNWAWAHTNLIEVVARCRDGDTVYVTNNSTYYLTNQIGINYAINLRSWAPDGGLDPDTTILDGNYPNTTNRLFVLNNYGAWIRGLTLTNGCFWSTSTVSPWAGGGAVSMRYGHLTNCIITGNRNYHNFDGSVNGGGGMFLGAYASSSGSVWNCRIIGNSSTNNSGGGVKISYGGPWVFDHCIIAGNDTTNGGGGGVSVYTTTALDFRDCQIISNISRLGGGGIAASGAGEFNRCLIKGNVSRLSSGAGIHISASMIARNCVIFDNTCLPSGSSIGAGAYIASGSNSLVENCTIFSNTATYSGGVGFAATGRVDNCIVWGNTGTSGISNYWIAPAALAVFTNTCTAPDPAAYGANCIAAGCIATDPLLDGAGRVNVTSPCVNAGINRAWMAGARDFEGITRIDRFSGVVDMGAYEFLPHGIIFLLR